MIHLSPSHIVLQIQTLYVATSVIPNESCLWTKIWQLISCLVWSAFEPQPTRNSKKIEQQAELRELRDVRYGVHLARLGKRGHMSRWSLRSASIPPSTFAKSRRCSSKATFRFHLTSKLAVLRALFFSVAGQ